MEKLYLLTVTGLDTRADWRTVRDRLIGDFPGVSDVLATTLVGTILILYVGAANVDAWLDAVSAAVLDRRRLAATNARSG